MSDRRKYRGRPVGRARVGDMMFTFDGQYAFDGRGHCIGKRFGHPVRTNDGKTYDSTGAFMVGQLEQLDRTLHEPLVAYTWSRDIDLRGDVSNAQEQSSFTVSSYGSPGGLGTGNSIGNGKSWGGKVTTQVTRQSVDIAKIVQPLTIWEQEVAYTIPELESSALLGTPIDTQKYNAMKIKNQMDIDEQVYFGDSGLGFFGLLNSDSRTGSDAVTTVSNVANGASGSPLWANKTPAEILADVNTLLLAVWTASAWAVVPSRLLLPPNQYGLISTQTVSLAGSVSILKYLEENNIVRQANKKLEILPCKWCVGTGSGGTVGTENGHNRMIAYTKEEDRVRFPMTTLAKTALQYDGIWQKCTYWGRLGVLEIVYPETIGYADGLG